MQKITCFVFYFLPFSIYKEWLHDFSFGNWLGSEMGSEISLAEMTK